MQDILTNIFVIVLIVTFIEIFVLATAFTIGVIVDIVKWIRGGW